MQPKISVITVVFNNVSEIKETMLSVLNQDYPDLEYIVIDGGSNDGTLEIIENYKLKIENDEFKNVDFKYISEKDSGIYEAMNKGIELATGEWITNVNAGDVLLEIPLIILAMPEIKKYDALCGSVIINNNKIIEPEFNWKMLIHNTLPHQGLYYNKEKLYAAYDTKYRIYSDFAYNIGMYKRKQKVYLYDKILCFHSTNGISNDKCGKQELFQIVKQQCGWFFEIVSFVYFKYQGLRLRIENVMKI
jgi:glycosyltransferase involved in cell wall biosynthesis